MPGGQVATTVVACQTWGLRTRYVGKLGDDDAARLHEEAFERAGVEAQLIKVPGGVSPQSLILVDAGGERTVLCRRDEHMTLKPEELRREWVMNARVLHVDGHDTAAATLAASWARAAGIPVVADLDDTYPGIEELVANIDYLIVSKDFPCRLMDDDNLERALRRMHSRYGCRLSAATLGEDGVLAWDGKQLLHCAAYRVPVADTTGAGDIFRAGFILRLAAGVAAGAAARFLLRGGGHELHGAGRARRHSARGCDREPDGRRWRGTRALTTCRRQTEP